MHTARPPKFGFVCALAIAVFCCVALAGPCGVFDAGVRLLHFFSFELYMPFQLVVVMHVIGAVLYTLLSLPLLLFSIAGLASSATTGAVAPTLTPLEGLFPLCTKMQGKTVLANPCSVISNNLLFSTPVKTPIATSYFLPLRANIFYTNLSVLFHFGMTSTVCVEFHTSGFAILYLFQVIQLTHHSAAADVGKRFAPYEITWHSTDSARIAFDFARSTLPPDAVTWDCRSPHQLIEAFHSLKRTKVGVWLIIIKSPLLVPPFTPAYPHGVERYRACQVCLVMPPCPHFMATLWGHAYHQLSSTAHLYPTSIGFARLPLVLEKMLSPLLPAPPQDVKCCIPRQGCENVPPYFLVVPMLCGPGYYQLSSTPRFHFIFTEFVCWPKALENVVPPVAHASPRVGERHRDHRHNIGAEPGLEITHLCPSSENLCQSSAQKFYQIWLMPPALGKLGLRILWTLPRAMERYIYIHCYLVVPPCLHSMPKLEIPEYNQLSPTPAHYTKITEFGCRLQVIDSVVWELFLTTPRAKERHMGHQSHPWVNPCAHKKQSFPSSEYFHSGPTFMQGHIFTYPELILWILGLGDPLFLTQPRDEELHAGHQCSPWVVPCSDIAPICYSFAGFQPSPTHISRGLSDAACFSNGMALSSNGQVLVFWDYARFCGQLSDLPAFLDRYLLLGIGHAFPDGPVIGLLSWTHACFSGQVLAFVDCACVFGWRNDWLAFLDKCLPFLTVLAFPDGACEGACFPGQVLAFRDNGCLSDFLALRYGLSFNGMHFNWTDLYDERRSTCGSPPMPNLKSLDGGDSKEFLFNAVRARSSVELPHDRFSCIDARANHNISRASSTSSHILLILHSLPCFTHHVESPWPMRCHGRLVQDIEWALDGIGIAHVVCAHIDIDGSYLKGLRRIGLPKLNGGKHISSMRG